MGALASRSGREPAVRRAGGRVRHYARTFSGFDRDARIYLLTTLAYGSALSLYWTDFNLYLQALGIGSAIGLVAATGQLAAAAAALPASYLSDRFGRRSALIAGAALVVIGLGGFLAGNVPLLFVSAAVYSAGSQVVNVVQVPFMAERTRPEHRSEYFSAQYAVMNVTNFLAAVVGGRAAVWLADTFHLPAGTGPYQVLLVAMVVLTVLGLATMFLLTDDRPGHVREGQPREGEVGSPGPTGSGGTDAATRERRIRTPRLHVPGAERGLLVRLLVPGFVISLGAGQVIPFLNVFIKGKFDLDLSTLNDVFAVTSLGTAIAIILQPALAKRYGKVASVVLVEAASLPFILVLGFSPILWTVILAMAVRNSLMNAGNPIYNAFAMEQLSPGVRATYAASASLLWSIGWAIAGPYYYVLQQTLGFDLGYAVNFVTIIVLYTLGTALQWFWFGRPGPAEPSLRATPAVAAAPD